MKFKNYLNEGRSKSLELEEAIKLINSNCSQALKQYKKEHVIYRALDDNNMNNYLLTKPTGKKRKSVNTYNHYTLIMNNHPMWKKYPKRQIICSGGNGERAIEQISGGFEEVYVVLPYDGAKIGICPKDDVWDSFFRIQDEGWGCMDDFNDWLYNARGIEDDNWKKFMEQTKDNEMRVAKHKNSSIWDYISDKMEPTDNHFKVVSISSYNVKKNENVEVWTDSPCVLARAFWMDAILDED